MSLTVTEAKQFILDAQNESSLEFYRTHPKYLEASAHNPARTLEDIRAGQGQDPDSDIDWNEGADAVVNGTTVKSVDQAGGEGEGDSCYVVFQIGDQYFEKDGYYASYDGFYWDEGDDLYEVEPYDVTVTKYRKVK